MGSTAQFDAGKTILPDTIVYRAQPLSRQRWNGEFLLFDLKALISTAYSAFRSTIVISASLPIARLPLLRLSTRAGLQVNFSTACLRLITFCATRESVRGSVVSRPMIPNAASSYSTSFSREECG